MTTRFTVLVGMALVALVALSGVAWAAVGPLAVTKTVPNGGASGIAPTADVKVYFNHDIRRSTVTSATFKIRKQGTTTWLGAARSVNNTVSPTSTNGGSQSVVTLNPNADLAQNTTYQVVVVGGASGVKGVDGNTLGANKSWTFTTVGTPPDTAIDSGPSGPVASDSASFSFSSSKTGSTFRCSLDGVAFAGCTSPESYNGLSQGPHTFRVRATDATGNADPTPASRRWTVDTIGPNASITDGPPSPFNSRSASFTFEGAEDGGGYQCKIDGTSSTGTFAACSSGESFSVEADGTYTLSVKAGDALGNFGTPVSRSWTVDTIAPTIDPVSPANTATLIAPSTNVTATFSEAMASSSISGQTFTLTPQGSTSQVEAGVSYDSTTKKATLDPSSDLARSTTYTATIKGGSNGVKDVAGNTLVQDHSWTFTTKLPIDVTPSPLDFTPNATACNVLITKTVTITNDAASQVDLVPSVTRTSFSVASDELHIPSGESLDLSVSWRAPLVPPTFKYTDRGSLELKDADGNIMATGDLTGNIFCPWEG